MPLALGGMKNEKLVEWESQLRVCSLHHRRMLPDPNASNGRSNGPKAIEARGRPKGAHGRAARML